MTLLLAIVCGLVVANIYYVQPLAGPIASALGLPPSATGLIVTLTQVGYAITSLRLDSATNALALLVLAAVLVDFGLTLNVVIGQRAIYGLAPELRSRLNGLFGASAFVGGAAGSALGGWAFAHGGWPWAATLGAAFPLLALMYFGLMQR